MSEQASPAPGHRLPLASRVAHTLADTLTLSRFTLSALRSLTLIALRDLIGRKCQVSVATDTLSPLLLSPSAALEG